MKLLTTPKAWFQANVDATLRIYARDHNIQKEDLLLGKCIYNTRPPWIGLLRIFLVIGALQVQNYALFLSHKHPDGHVSFMSLPCPCSSLIYFCCHFVRLISISFRLKRKDIHGERSRLIRASLRAVAVLAMTSPFVRKVIATAKFPW